MPRSELFDQLWMTSLLRPLLIIVLAVCMNIVVAAVATRFVTGVAPWFFWGLTAIASAAATAGVVSTTVMALPSNRINRSAGYRAAEIGLFLALTRIFVWMAGGGFPSLQQMLETPLTLLIDPLFFVCAIIVTLSWLIASEVTEDLNQLALTADEMVIVEWRSDRNNDTMRAAGIDRGDLLAAFTIRWVTLGLLLIMLVALVRQGLSFNGFFAVLRQEIEPAVMAAVILYFLAGLLLLSHGRLAMLRARWTLERTPSSGEVTRRWPLYVIMLVGGLALAALLLPFGGTFLLATVLTWIIGGLFAIILAIYRFVAWALLWLFSLIMGEPTPPPPAELATPAPSEAALPPANLPPIFPEWLGGALFWAAIVALVAYAAVVYFREKGVRFGWLGWLWAMLRRRWQEVVGILRAGQRRLNLTGTLPRDAERPSLFPWRRRSFRDADEQVRYLYLATLHEASEAGLARAPAETPLHYRPRLEEGVRATQDAAAEGLMGEGAIAEGALAEGTIDTAADDANAQTVRALTEAFQEVRYAGLHAEPSLAEQLQQRWQQLRRALQERKE